MKKVMKNTKKQGGFTTFVYRYEENHFLGVCLEFNLITEGRTAPEAIQNIFRASCEYVRVIIKNDLSDKLLNLIPEQKYLKEYSRLLKRRAQTIEKIEKSKKKEEKLISWDKYFSSQDFRYNPKFLKDAKEEVCI